MTTMPRTPMSILVTPTAGNSCTPRHQHEAKRIITIAIGSSTRYMSSPLFWGQKVAPAPNIRFENGNRDLGTWRCKCPLAKLEPNQKGDEVSLTKSSIFHGRGAPNGVRTECHSDAETVR